MVCAVSVAARHRQALVILAGGTSSRMGRDKALLAVAGVSQLVRLAHLGAGLGLPIIVCGRTAPADWAGPAATFLPDAVAGEGPLRGLVTGLEQAEEVVLVACDLPRLEASGVQWLRDRPSGVWGAGTVRAGQPEPLASRYRRACLPGVLRELAVGRRSPRALLAAPEFTLHEVPADLAAQFDDADTPADWQRLTKR